MKNILVSIALISVIALAACNGGGKDGTPPPDNNGVVTINDLIVNPAQPGATSLVEITLDAAATVTPIEQRTKTYTATGGTLYAEQPDFTLVLRNSAQAGPATLSTKQNKIYWITPATPVQVTLTVEVGGKTHSKVVSIGNSLATMSIEEQGSNKVVTVSVNGVSDLFQAAFRVNYQTSKYTAVSVEKGDFLGSGALFIGLPDKLVGSVPVSISRKRGEGGSNGNGVLARIIFAPKTTSGVRDTSASAAFDFEYVELRDSSGDLIGLD
ncbi:MAG: hypothetical protein HRF49_03405 [bacterium]|jgi:hypothetical protein